MASLLEAHEAVDRINDTAVDGFSVKDGDNPVAELARVWGLDPEELYEVTKKCARRLAPLVAIGGPAALGTAFLNGLFIGLRYAEEDTHEPTD